MKKHIILLALCAILIMFLGGSTVSAADVPNANFTSNVTNGSDPLSIQFNDTSTGSATKWSWDFGDSQTSTEQNPVHNYTKNGVYTVSLTAGNDDGNNIITKTDYITVLPTATANLTAGTYKNTQTVKLTSDDPTAATYYTNDTTDPRSSSSRIQYTEPITISKTTTLRYAVLDSAGSWSSLYVQNYVIGSQTSINAGGQSSYTGAATNTTYWNYTTAGRVYASAIVGPDGTIYIGSGDKNLYAINPNGTLKWNYTTGGSITYAAPVIGADGTIYIVSTDKNLYAINPDGTLKWNYTTGGSIFSAATIGPDGTIYIGSGDNKLYAINPDGTLKWNYTTGSIIYGSASIGSDGTIYVGSGDNKLYAINPDGTLKWNYTTIGFIYNYGGTPIIGSDGTIYFGSSSSNSIYKFYAMNPNGTVKWTYTPGGLMYYAAVIGGDGTIYLGCDDSKLYAINPDGTLKWNYTTGGSIRSAATIGADGTIYIGSMDYKLYAINPNGTLKWTYVTGNAVRSSVAIGSDGTIYFGSGDKNIYAVKDVLPVANFTVNTTVVNESLPVQFTDNSTYGTSWSWNFGDGNTSTDKNPAHTYTKPGIYTVTLTVTNAVGNTTETKTSYITVKDITPPTVAANVTTGVFNTTQSVNLTATDESSTTIYYSLNGGTSTEYKDPITVNSTTILSYIAVDAAGNLSPLYMQVYTIDTTAPTVTADKITGTYNTAQSVKLTSDDPTATIYYTTDGSNPQTSSTKIKYTNTIGINTTTTLKYTAVDTAGNWEATQTQIYTLDTNAPTASANIPSGTYNTNKVVTLTMSENGAIYYTLNGATPTAASAKYTSPIAITSTTTLKFIAVDNAGNTSPVYMVTYTLDKTAPKISSVYPKSNAKSVSRTSTITIKFTENIKADINWSKVYIKNLKTGKTVAVSKQIKNNTLYLKTSKKSANTSYKIYIPAAALKDNVGNKLAKGYTWTFKTGKK